MPIDIGAAIRQAKSEEEQEMYRKDTDFLQFSFTFEGEEKEIVKAALGKEPAEKLVKLCRAEVSRMNAEGA